MKGLLTKDIHLLLRQKNTLLLMVLILALISRHGLEFTLGYFILLSFSLGNSTIGYDAAERGMLYMMTLPVSRTVYVIEKYVVTLVPAVFATGIALVIRFAEANLQGLSTAPMEIAFSCLVVFFLLSLAVAIMLPMELLGREKAQLLMNIVAVAMGILIFILMKNGTMTEPIREYTMNAVNGSSKTGLGAGIVGSWLVIMASSILCSVAIMKKKEF